MNNLSLSNYLAKPTESILEHNENLYHCVQVLKDFGYLTDTNIEELLNICIYYHDFGKMNEEFQKRILNHNKFNSETEIYHNILSIFFIDKTLFKNIDDYYRCVHIVLNHHNYCNPYYVLNEQRDLINYLLRDFDTFKIVNKTLLFSQQFISDNKTIITKGLLHRCDYASSSHLPIEYKNDFLVESLNDFRIEKNILWNELQTFCINNRENNILTIGKTGMGKTEAALLWGGNHKLFFFLPLQTINNCIYKRIKDMVKEDVDHRVGLLHSNNLNIYMDDENSDILQHYKLSKQFSLPITVSTIDQLFDFVFRYCGYEVKLATLSYSRVIVDEIQMYDPKMLAYLIFGLEKINQFGGKIAITTATLSPFIKDLLTKHIDFKFGIFTNNLLRHHVKVYHEELEVDKILQHYENHKNDESCKMLIVVNTVKKSQIIFDKLKKQGIENVHLLHSKFNKQDRIKKEKEIIEDGQTENHKTSIWISTQIVEASLDIDFDYLFTELSDLSGLFQRFGRCNRKGKKNIDEYNCFVFTKINKNIIGKVVDKTMYELSKNAIETFDGKMSEDEKLEMINETFTTENIKDSDYFYTYRKTYNQLNQIHDYDFEKSEIDLREIESYPVLPKNIFEENEEKIEEITNTLQTEKLKIIDKMKLENEIKNLCISVDGYYKQLIWKNLITEICLNKYEKIFVVDCEYNEEIGFRWKKEETEEKFL